MAVTGATMNPAVEAKVTREVITHYSPRAVHRRRAIAEFIVALAMAAACGLLFWGSGFATNMVHDQLTDQKISFPKADQGLPANLSQYAGQVVDSGPKAKAYANDYIALHLKDVNEGKTYSETSGMARAARGEATAAKDTPKFDELNAKATALEGQVQTLFRGETLRGLLLYAWGWWLVGRIAFVVAIVALIGALVLTALAVLGVVQYRRDPALS